MSQMNGKSILVIDDSMIIVAMLSRELSDAGFNNIDLCGPRQSGGRDNVFDHALMKLSPPNPNFALVITDAMMPGYERNGHGKPETPQTAGEAIFALCKIKGIPCIVHTADPDVVIRVRSLGGTAYNKTEANRSELVPVVQQLLGLPMTSVSK